MHEFFKAMAKLLRERFPGWTITIHYDGVLIKMPGCYVYFILKENRIYNNPIAGPIMHFDIADPSFDPENVVKWIHEQKQEAVNEQARH